MFITFGTRFYGKVAKHNGQWIESKFFSIMFIPVFPISSMYVTRSEFRKRAGFAMETNSKSVTAGYGRVLPFVVAAFLLWANYAFEHGYGGNTFAGKIYLAIAIACIAMGLYFCFFYGKATPEDVAMRNKVGLLTGFYALPHWFEYYQLTGFLAAFENKYKQAYPGGDWKTDLAQPRIPPEKQQLLFGIALFNCMVNNKAENDELYAKADAAWQVNTQTNS